MPLFSLSQPAQFWLFGLTTGITLSAVATFLSSIWNQENVLAPRSTAALMPLRLARHRVPMVSSPFDVPDETLETISRLQALFTVSGPQLTQLVRHMIAEMKKGLQDDNHSLKMIPSHVIRRPQGSETGSFLALDLGGSNFRVCEVSLEGNGKMRVQQRKYTVSEQLKRGSGEQLFNFFADSVLSFLQEIGDTQTPRKLGFTFSFPVKQTSIKHGYLLYWTKGFSAASVEGLDVVQLLQEALNRKGVNVTVTAIVNDTTGTLISHSYSHPNTYIGVILGTGSNAAYVEKAENVPKYKQPMPTGEIIINTEWGAFDDEHVFLPRTKYDAKLDRASVNAHQQTFEKMMSGMYLGEVVRYVLVDLIKTGELFKGRSSDKLSKPYSFETIMMSRIERDHTLDLSDTRTVLEELFGVEKTSLSDRRIVRAACELVGKRAARLAAAGIAAIVTKIKKLNGCTVAVDGSLFELYPHFANRMRDALNEILGLSAENILLEQARDGSGQGAALIAALADKE
ncbi:hexokinase-domain-containing protein [Zopfochytrium polystomum]|nr:hexokinase-domain-containing protein [Zopfochytrium polystomum]